ncbi:MFS transporter [Priestia megaterium]|uniref:MFS transporter n=1 Tax=Priestia megaterium TaxID=1404 RepID=UPI0011B6C9E3|nr:MFS transporter [Priestia megaterium]QDZ88255.1 MFS transporter [Priestia megaterium]
MLDKDNSKVLEDQLSWLQSYIDSSEKKSQLYKRTLVTVIISQIFGGAGLAAGVTVGALLAQNMLGTDSVTGIPTALFTLGSAGAALLIGRISQRFGRRFGLTTGFLAGGIGAIGVIISSLTTSIGLLFVSLLIYGAGTATNLLARYAGTDLANSKQRATAASMALVSTTFGAVMGPMLVDVMGNLALSMGIPALAGPFILAAAAYILAGLILLAFLRPDPFIVAKAIANAQQTNGAHLSEEEANGAGTNKREIFTGTTVMVMTQFVMIAIMTMTPIHMGHHGHNLKEVGLVIGLHVGAMFFPSLITGYLVDKVGRTIMAIASGITLLASGILAAVGPADSMALLITALVLLGLGWNFGLISGTAIIIDATHPSTRAKIQGSIDVLIALSGALGGGLSGMVVAHSSYATLSFAGATFSLVVIPVIVWSRINQNKGQ